MSLAADACTRYPLRSPRTLTPAAKMLVPAMKRMPTKRAINLYNQTVDAVSVDLAFDNLPGEAARQRTHGERAGKWPACCVRVSTVTAACQLLLLLLLCCCRGPPRARARLHCLSLKPPGRRCRPRCRSPLLDTGAVLPCCHRHAPLGSFNVSGIHAVIAKYNESGKISIHARVDQGGLFSLDKAGELCGCCESPWGQLAGVAYA